ncbi:response regulator transcription factor [Metabacillus malikii]|uniref:Two-component system response regulator YesN n=1 Tax=Metabacillus malikii TaxID=1504265 RepID=A0ABT9ZDF7_9BACI|nr:response regulator transcription factor [Metabacillus malikii]MDQ0230306.1 two-component system response regulator YesN [Metabacillus malikii]
MTVRERGRVLIVDDEVLIRQGIKHYLNWEQEGFEIVGEASNGKEALQLIETENPHIIITDIVMPIMDGEELTRVVKERYPYIEVIILSSFGEFDYVRSTFQNGVVDYILKPKLDAKGILKALHAAVKRIPSLQMKENNSNVNLSIEQIIQRLIAGYDVQYDEKQIGDTFPYHNYCLLGVTVNGVGSVKSLQVELEEYVSEQYLFHLEKDFLLVNGNDFSALVQHLNAFGKSNLHYQFVMSETFTDFSQLGNIYKGSLAKLLNYRFFFPEVPLLTKEILPSIENDCMDFNLDLFTSEMKRKNFESAFIHLREHVEIMSKCYTMDVYEYKSFFGNVIFNVTVLLGNMEYEVRELNQSKYAYFKSIDEAKSANAVIELLDQFILEVRQCINSSKDHFENLNIKKLLEYIKNHYAEPLTLSEVAKHFHFNPSYLSSYFSNHSDEGFIEYLNRIRIEEASKLLVERRATISEISGMVGYSDHSYFCKVFKKFTGLSPSQYRRKQNMR